MCALVLGEKGFGVSHPADSDPGVPQPRWSTCWDPNGGPRDRAPLFRDPMIGLELRYSEVARELKSLLPLIGVPILANGLHSSPVLTPFAEMVPPVAYDNAEGSPTAGFMGHWASNAKFGYMFAQRPPRPKVECAALSFGRALPDPGPFTARPGPVRDYAAGCDCD